MKQRRRQTTLVCLLLLLVAHTVIVRCDNDDAVAASAETMTRRKRSTIDVSECAAACPGQCDTTVFQTVAERRQCRRNCRKSCRVACRTATNTVCHRLTAQCQPECYQQVASQCSTAGWRTRHIRDIRERASKDSRWRQWLHRLYVCFSTLVYRGLTSTYMYWKKKPDQQQLNLDGKTHFLSYNYSSTEPNYIFQCLSYSTTL